MLLLIKISGEDYDFLEDVGDWFKENLSVDEISDKLSEIYNEVRMVTPDKRLLKKTQLFNP